MSLNDFPQRLDVYLANNSLAPSRESAKKLISSGYVLVDGINICKPSFLVTESAEVTVLENDMNKYVSRGALKLEEALNKFSVSVEGLVAADIGASTGGFTDVLLQRGATHVYAIENGNGQLHPKLLSDSRVTSMENVNARYIEQGFIPMCDIVVMDVSFISQTKLFHGITNILKEGGILISLIKPQFEAGKENIGKNGIVKDDGVRRRVIQSVCDDALLYGLENVSVISSPILGGYGNKEFLAYFINKGRVK